MKTKTVLIVVALGVAYYVFRKAASEAATLTKANALPPGVAPGVGGTYPARGVTV